MKKRICILLVIFVITITGCKKDNNSDLENEIIYDNSNEATDKYNDNENISENEENDSDETEKSEKVFLNVKYGPHERNVMDIYLADSYEKTPVIIYFHSEGFFFGEKSSFKKS